MNLHDVNIGNCETAAEHDAWWKDLLDKNIITAGFDGELGDQGTNILCRKIKKGDWIFAYASGHGYVGIGLAESLDTYELLALPPKEHPHRRGVRWLYYVESLNDAIPTANIGVYHPVPAHQTIDKIKGEKILKALLNNIKIVIRW